MSQRPQTLLELGGVAFAAADWTRAALVIIDAQREYSVGRLRLPALEPAVTEIARLLAAARAADAPVFHVVQCSPPGRGLFDESRELVVILSGLEPRAGEVALRKRLPNAFAGTTLAEQLRATGRSELVLCGFMTHMCVSATARAALDLGFRSTIVAAATATRELPDPLGGVIPAELVQSAALAELADRFCAVVPSAAALRARAAEPAT